MSKKVLIVDDDQEMLRMLQKDLEKYQRIFSVLTAKDGLAALDMIKKNDISLVVTELEMPRLDGFTLLTHLNENYPDIQKMIITGQSTPAKEEYAMEQGVERYLKKPFRIEDLAKDIITTLKKEEEGGVLHGISPGTFLQLLEMEQKTCTIRLAEDKSGNHGALFFIEGELLDARFNELHGREAAYLILSWEEATLAIQESCSIKANKIQADLQAILLEAMRLKDEKETEQQEKMTQEQIDEYIAAEGEKEKKRDIAREVESPETILEKSEPNSLPEKREPVPVISRESIKKDGKAGLGGISPTPSKEGAAVSYSVADNIFGTLGDLKGLIFDSLVIRYLFRFLAVGVIVCLMGLAYLFLSLETEKELISHIDEAKAIIKSKQKELYQLDEEIQQVYNLREDKIRYNESQAELMELDLKISELEEEQGRIQAETKIQQELMEEWQINLEAMKRKPLVERLTEKVKELLPEKLRSTTDRPNR